VIIWRYHNIKNDIIATSNLNLLFTFTLIGYRVRILTIEAAALVSESFCHAGSAVIDGIAS
jgi:hypothetical protein